MTASSFWDGLVGVSGASSTISTMSTNSPVESALNSGASDDDEEPAFEEEAGMLRIKSDLDCSAEPADLNSFWWRKLSPSFWLCGLAAGSNGLKLCGVRPASPDALLKLERDAEAAVWPSSAALLPPRSAAATSSDWLGDQRRIIVLLEEHEKARKRRLKQRPRFLGSAGRECADRGDRRSGRAPRRPPTRDDEDDSTEDEAAWKPLPLAFTATSATMTDAVTEALEQLTADQIEQFRKYFNMFDKEQKGFIRANQVGQILRTMGQAFEDRDLKQLIKEFDSDGSGEIEFEEFAAMVANFVVAAEDNEGLEEELREAFRLYDKEGNGYINVSDLREILRALDDNVSEEELDEMIAEIDTDGSEFMEMMSGE